MGLGGAERMAALLARGLEQQGFGVKIYAISVSRYVVQELGVGHLLTKFTPFPSIKFLGIYQSLLSGYFGIRQVADKCDVVIQTGGGHQPIVETPTCRIVYWQGIWTRVNVKYQNGVWKYYYLPYKVFSSLGTANVGRRNLVLLVNSEFTRVNLARDLELDPAQMTVVYPPVELSKWAEGRKSSIREGVVNLSRFSPEKEHVAMMDCLRNIGTRFDMIGNTVNLVQEQYLAKLKRLRNVIDPTMIFGDNITQESTIARLQRAKVYFHGCEETFGLTTVEAMAAGCIPVVPNNSGHRETVPFEQLRYNTVEEARKKVVMASKGDYDYLLPEIHRHVEQFDVRLFLERMKQQIVRALSK